MYTTNLTIRMMTFSLVGLSRGALTLQLYARVKTKIGYLFYVSTVQKSSPNVPHSVQGVGAPLFACQSKLAGDDQYVIQKFRHV